MATPDQDSPIDVMALVAEINDKLMQLNETVSESDITTKNDKERIRQLVTEYQDFVQNNLSGEPGQDAPEQQLASREMPEQVGVADVRPAL